MVAVGIGAEAFPVMVPRCGRPRGRFLRSLVVLLLWGSALGTSPFLPAEPGERDSFAGAVTAVGILTGLAAQEPPRRGDGTGVEEGKGGGWLSVVAGQSPERNRLIVGLWAMHPFEPHFPELDGTDGFGGLWGHWFGATFVNSYGARTFIAGIERDWLSLRRGPFGAGLGYRVGLVTGYDERLIGIAGHTPVLPFGGLLLWTQVGPISVDAYYVYRAITLETGLVFPREW